ncbi:MAG: UvrD-helicase domain-containing protein [Deltaproteobacteria bacterium]|nr:UvrD-helicase domain-containing protein [Deltaproteobacteria bacterium]
MTHSPPDDLERTQATTTFDRNVVVTAGAGTGKTTLLVQRCVNLLMREPDPVQMTELVALTFTNKAANEMKERLRDRLEVLAGRGVGPESAEPGEMDALRERYHLTADDIGQRAEEALKQLERAQIGTIHSFAAWLLRLYPLETGLDPQFREDDGTLRKRRFDTEWALWLDEELSGTSPRTAEWKQVLGQFPLDRLRELALALCAENVDLDGLGRAGSPEDPASPIAAWLRAMDESVTDLIARHPQRRKIEQALAAAQKVIRSLRFGVAPADDAELKLLEGKPSRVKGWTAEDFSLAGGLLEDAAALARVDPAEVDRVCALLAPFAREFRKEFARNGRVSFDGLLVRARDLLCGHPRIREELKARFKAILVDEFQDTDPLQYEILLWLCEERSRQAANWRDIRLTPGKLFVVGDPKQSIYGFRGADMEAYLNVVKEVLQAQDGVECRLTANFRSDPRILDVVNGLFESLIREEPGLQPEYIALQSGLDGDAWEPAPGELGQPGKAPAGQGRKPVMVRRVTSPGRTLKAEEARRLEAESLARWLKEEVLGRTFFQDREGRRVAVEPGHVAFLMRALTNVQVYLEALRRHDVGYVVEGERDFYAAQEVVDAINLLRAIDNPYDRLALVGVLRSPVGGCDDAEIFALSQRNLLDYRRASSSRWVDLPGTVLDLYQRLLRLHRELRFLEAGTAVERVFKELPLSVLAAGRSSGQQAVANLEKVRLVAQEAGAGGSGTLKDVVAELERRVREREDESENALEEETLDAVRIMSIHRAKGLEFPVVVLPDALGGVNRRPPSTVEVSHDWATGLTGIHMDDLWSLPGVFLQAKRRQRDAHEQRRLLYVAITRPREQLVVSFADRGPAGDSMVSLIEDATGHDLLHAAPSEVACGAGAMAVEVVTELPGADEHGKRHAPPLPDTADWSWYEDLWRRRREEHDTRRQTPLFLSPTRLKGAGEAAETPIRPTGLDRDTALELGRLAHAVLEHWDFQTRRIEEDLDDAVARHIPELPPAQREAVLRELKAMWAALAGSPVYEELKDARILGREIPFVLPWDDGAVMEGVIDVVYERDGQLYVADYKTDQVADDDIDGVMHDYRHQARIYTEAVRRTLGRDVAGFKLLLLRLGRGVEVPPEIAGMEP